MKLVRWLMAVLVLSWRGVHRDNVCGTKMRKACRIHIALVDTLVEQVLVDWIDIKVSVCTVSHQIQASHCTRDSWE